MKKFIFFACGVAAVSLVGCAMKTAWKAIPPPGGCDQCHSVPISANWTVAYSAPTLRDEKDKLYFQTEKYSMPNTEKPKSALDMRKTTDESCFECHRAPSPSHRGRKGRFHH
jgi:hypothetical protein